MKKHKIISIWVIEDNHLFQNNLVTLVNDQKYMKCERVFSSCEEAIGALRLSTVPDVVLHDIGFAGMDGITSVDTIKKLYPKIQIIMLTVFDDAEHVFDALRAGATGYLLKSSSEKSIVGAIRDVISGGSPMNSSIARKVTEYFSKTQNSTGEYHLTLREKDILEQIIQGFSNKKIAEKLHISAHTVDGHLRKIYDKLQVHGRTQAATKVLKERLI